MSNEIAKATPAPVANGTISFPIDEALVLSMFNLNPKEPNTQAMLLTCRRYGLDPVLKHVLVLEFNRQKTMYVTRDGLLHVAHMSGQFDGLEIVETGETNSHFTAVAAVYRKDMSRPFRFPGRFPKSKNHFHGPEMAEKVAVSRALRHAFAIGLCSADETWEVESDDTPSVRAEVVQEAVRPVAEAPASVQKAAPVNQPKPADKLETCSVDGCGNVLTYGQNTMSMQKFGKPICLMHQRQQGNTAPATAPVATATPAPQQMTDIQKELTALITDFQRELQAHGLYRLILVDGKRIAQKCFDLIATLSGSSPVDATQGYPDPRDIQAAIDAIPGYAKQILAPKPEPAPTKLVNNFPEPPADDIPTDNPFA